MRGAVQVVPSGTKVLRMSNFAEDGYGKVQKVRIVGMEDVFETICSVIKDSKAVDKTEK